MYAYLGSLRLNKLIIRMIGLKYLDIKENRFLLRKDFLYHEEQLFLLFILSIFILSFPFELNSNWIPLRI